MVNQSLRILFKGLDGGRVRRPLLVVFDEEHQGKSVNPQDMRAKSQGTPGEMPLVGCKRGGRSILWIKFTTGPDWDHFAFSALPLRSR